MQDNPKVNVKAKQTTVDALRHKRVRKGRHGMRGAGVEHTKYRLKAQLVALKREPDGDIHLVIAQPGHRKHTMVVEFPDKRCVVHARARGARVPFRINQARGALLAVCPKPPRGHFTELTGSATIIGLGFFDFEHARGHSKNAVELHPVLGFKGTCHRKTPRARAAARMPVRLGKADSFAVLAGQTVTSTGFSTLNGDLGVSPGSALTGFPPGKVNGTVHATDPVATQAQSDLTTAYNDAAGRTPPQALPADVGGRTLAPGVYKSGTTLGLTGGLTLDGNGDRNAVFVFQIGSALTTAVGSDVRLVNGAQACNVFWQIGSSATLGTSSVFAGSILAYTSISMSDRVTLNGRALARNGAVTLINDTITAPHCG